MDAQRVKQFVTLTRRKKAAEGELKAVKAELAILEEILRDEFASDDFQSVHQGGMTVYMHRQWWARLKKDAHEASIDFPQTRSRVARLHPRHDQREQRLRARARTDSGCHGPAPRLVR